MKVHKIFLREIIRQDIQIINRWRNDPKLVKYLATPYRYINIETDESWFENYQKNRHFQLRCAILDTDEKIIGVVYLLNIDHVNRNAELAIMISEDKSRNKGIGLQVINLILNHAFKDLNLKRVYLFVLENNGRAIHVYKKCGFTEEGLLRAAVYKNGSYIDLKVMSILKDEFTFRT